VTQTLIVTAHPHSGSFTGSWAQETERASLATGGRVSRSDLVQDGFDPVEVADRPSSGGCCSGNRQVSGRRSDHFAFPNLVVWTACDHQRLVRQGAREWCHAHLRQAV